jgi:hypothetical protein
MIAPTWQNTSPRELGEQDLLRERDRLETMLKDGKLCTLHGTRLAEVRRCLKRLDQLKHGADGHGF